MFVEIRKRLVRPHTILGLCTTLLTLSFVTACGEQALTPQGAAVRALAAEQAAADPGGAAIYRGVFFYEGEVARQLPELAGDFAYRERQSEETRAKDAALVGEIVGTIEKLDPAFFAGFERDMESGDPVRVEAALSRAGEMTLKALDHSPSVQGWRVALKENQDKVQAELVRLYDEGQISGEELSTAREQLELMVAGADFNQAQNRASWWRGWALAAAVALAVALVYPPAVGVAIVLVVAYAWAYAWSAKGAPEKALEREQLIDGIARTLARPTSTTGSDAGVTETEAEAAFTTGTATAGS